MEGFIVNKENKMTITKKKKAEKKETKSLPLQVKVVIEDGVCQDVYVEDAHGNALDFVLDIEDHDVDEYEED